MDQMEKDQMRRIAHSELGGGHSAAEIDQWLDSLDSLTYGETIAKAAAAEKEEQREKETVAEIRQRMKDNPHWQRMLDWDAYYKMLGESNVGKAISGGPGPSIVPPFGPLPGCVHEWAFLRTRSEDAYDSLGRPNDPMSIYSNHDSPTVDVFFCRRCLEYRTKGG